MNYRVKFINNNRRCIQITVVSNRTENFQIAQEKSDNSTIIPEGNDFTFYWRDDGAQCRICKEAGCNPHTLTMPASDLAITLPDPNGRWLKQSI